MRDPNQVFVISAITRAGIAEDLNEWLEEGTLEDRLAIDDDRLTDEICAEYAQKVGEVDEDMTDSAQAECFEEIKEETVNACGLFEDS